MLVKPAGLKIEPLRLYGFDLIRTFSFLAIALHHFTTELWNLPVFTPFSEVSLTWWILDSFSRTISFSGQTILFLSTFLIAYTSKHSEKANKLIPILIALWTISSLIDYSPNNIFWVWDIFPLIAVGLGIVIVVHKFLKRPNFFLVLLGFVLLCIPFWKFNSLIELPLFFRQILIGDCPSNLSYWPILPWVGLVFFGYGIGKFVQIYRSSIIQGFLKTELFLWALLLIGCPMYWGTYYNMRVGNQFSCEAMRQAPIAFFAHLIPIIFLMRIFMVNSVNNYLAKNEFIRKISSFKINTNFGMAYFCHFIVIDIIIYFSGIYIATSPVVSFIVAISILIITEVVLRIVQILQGQIKVGHYFKK